MGNLLFVGKCGVALQLKHNVAATFYLSCCTTVKRVERQLKYNIAATLLLSCFTTFKTMITLLKRVV